LNGTPILEKSFKERRELLSSIVDSSETLTITPVFDGGHALFQKAKELN